MPTPGQQRSKEVVIRSLSHAKAAFGDSHTRMQQPEGRKERRNELNLLADWYAERGDAETAADYRSQAKAVAV